jgi:hypothetical protein
MDLGLGQAPPIILPLKSAVIRPVFRWKHFGMTGLKQKFKLPVKDKDVGSLV